MMKEAIVQLDEVSVRYHLPQERVKSLKEYALRWSRGQNSFADFWALRDISLTANKGEAVGIIGANGAGKTTLLKVITRVLQPTTGRVRVRGVLAPILGLGGGFDPEMTGRENIFLIGAMLGYSRADMMEKLPRLSEFTGLDEFIDIPLRTYSDGMVARLVFAIATDVDADLLVIDEMLAVGDKDFQQKCMHRMVEFKDAGKTILLVSHNLDTIENFCSRVIWLEYGRVREVGKTSKVISKYKDEAVHPLVDDAQVKCA